MPTHLVSLKDNNNRTNFIGDYFSDSPSLYKEVKYIVPGGQLESKNLTSFIIFAEAQSMNNSSYFDTNNILDIGINLYINGIKVFENNIKENKDFFRYDFDIKEKTLSRNTLVKDYGMSKVYTVAKYFKQPLEVYGTNIISVRLNGDFSKLSHQEFILELH